MKTIKIYSICLLSFLLISFIGELRGQDLKVIASPGTRIVVQDSLKLIFHNASFINNGDFYSGNSSVTFSGDAKGIYSYIGGSAVSSATH